MSLTQIGPWILESRLGEGGMGTVYRCRHAQHPERAGALKLIRGPIDRELYQRFSREAWVLQGLAHPGVVRLIDVLLDEDPPALVMELAPGETLHSLRRRRGALSTTEALAVVERLADALAYVHARGIFHRDLKPANIMVVPGEGSEGPEVRIVDFGIALESERTRLTQPGVAPGSALYAPPEWLSDPTPDPARWDVFSLGAILHELLAGDLPYRSREPGGGSDRVMRMLAAKVHHLPLDPGPDRPPSLRALVRSMTTRDPDDRLPSAEAVIAALGRVQDELAGRGEPLLWLVCLNGEAPGQRYPLRYGVTRIGRGAGDGSIPTIDLSAQERQQPRRWVSRAHAELRLDGHGLTLRDLGSANGTFVNAAAVESAEAVAVRVGDSVGLGRLGFQVEDAD